MQSMMYDCQWKYRYARTEGEADVYGECVTEFKRSERVLISYRQTANTIEQAESGAIHRVGYRLYINNGHPFLQGDRIGTKDAMELQVDSVLDTPTGQVIEASQL